MAWVRSLAAVELSGDTWRLATQPGQRELINFVTDARKQQLAALIESVTGRRVRVVLSAPDAAANATDSRTGTTSQAERDRALALPLVGQVHTAFDSVTLVSVAPEYNDNELDQLTPPAETENPAADAETESEDNHV